MIPRRLIVNILIAIWVLLGATVGEANVPDKHPCHHMISLPFKISRKRKFRVSTDDVKLTSQQHHRVVKRARQFDHAMQILNHRNWFMFRCYSDFIKMNAKPSRIAFTTQRFDTPVYSR